MTPKATAKSRILEAVHATATDLHRLGFVDKRRQQTLEALCLEPIPAYDSAHIRALSQWHACAAQVSMQFRHAKAANRAPSPPGSQKKQVNNDRIQCIGHASGGVLV